MLKSLALRATKLLLPYDPIPISYCPYVVVPVQDHLVGRVSWAATQDYWHQFEYFLPLHRGFADFELSRTHGDKCSLGRQAFKKCKKVRRNDLRGLAIHS